MTNKIKEAALWLACSKPQLAGAIVPILKKILSLTDFQAALAIKEVNLIRTRMR